MFNNMKRGLFGRKNGAMGVMPGDQPDYGLGDYGTGWTPPIRGQQQRDPFQQQKSPYDTAPGQGFEQQQAPPQKQGFMSKLPGAMMDIGSILDDDDNGQSMQKREERGYNEQQARAKAQAEWQAKQEQRGYERDDWMFKEQNKKPTTNDTVADYDFIKSTLGDAAAQEYLRNKASPPVHRVGPDGQFYRVDTGGAPQQAPTRPVGGLIPIGGPASPAPGNFRP
jgi:hypothetical protein